MKQKRIDYTRLVLSILIAQCAGLIGSIFTYPSIIGWYSNLVKPGFTPPGWLFGPAWLTLYTLMGISLYLVWQKGTKREGVKAAICVFAVQLALNSAWSLLFFGLHSPLYGLVCITALWVAIAATMAKFYGLSRKACALLAPYLLWVTFAAVLNFYVLILN